jgi:hypothetical protein
MATTPVTTVLLHFAEEADHFRPADAQGNLDTLGVETGLTMPAIASAYTGPGRNFVAASSRGLVAADISGRDTLETRDVTVEVITSIRASSVATWPRAVYVRGLGDGTAAERYSLGLELNKLTAPASPTHLEMRLFWMDSTGTIQTQPSGTFIAVGDDDFVYLAATRRWVSTTEVVCRYYVNGELLAEVTSANGDIAGATTGHTTIGCRKNGGTYGRFWDGIVDELAVRNYEMCQEEIQATWQRITVDQPAGVDLVTAMAPPGSGWGRDRSTRMGKLVRVAGTLFGYALARARELRANWLPDRTYLADLPRWERLYGIAPKALDSLDTRRARVVAFASRDNGYSPEQLQEVLLDPFDVVTTDDVDILEFTNRVDDDFATLELERWHTEPAANWTIVSGALRGERASGVDARFDAANRNPYRCIMPLSSGEGRVVFLAKITALNVSADTLIGLHLFNWRSNNGLWVGLTPNAGVDYKLAYVSFKDGVQSALTTLVDPVTSASLPNWIRIIKDPDVAGRYVIGRSTIDALTGYTEVAVTGLMEDPEWAGFAVLGLDASGAGNNSMDFDEATIITPQGTRPFEWYAYRDPGIAGDPDILGANLLLRRLRPAHTHTAAITSHSVLCDDLDDGGCDRGPMGAL